MSASRLSLTRIKADISLSSNHLRRTRSSGTDFVTILGATDCITVTLKPASGLVPSSYLSICSNRIHAAVNVLDFRIHVVVRGHSGLPRFGVDWEDLGACIPLTGDIYDFGLLMR